MRSFLKWAGNKYQILSHILEAIPEGKRLIEPFVGSGAVFLNTDYEEYLLGDNNKDLINLFKLVQSEGKEFVDYCRSFFIPENNDEARYYEFREMFNNTQEVELRSALFFYLNRHGYNGLCRYNSSGIFNVPFGRYRKPYFPEEELQHFHEHSARAKFVHMDYMKVMGKAKQGDVVYCDPPYVPLSKTASFTNYSGQGFSMDQQEALAHEAERLAEQGIPVIISNHNTPVVKKLYNKAKIVNIQVTRTMSCDTSNRKKASEVIAVF